MHTLTCIMFQAVKAEQSILVDFAEFPSKFVELLEGCATAAGESSEQPKFSASLTASSGSTYLAIVETNQVLPFNAARWSRLESKWVRSDKLSNEWAKRRAWTDSETETESGRHREKQTDRENDSFESVTVERGSHEKAHQDTGMARDKLRGETE